MSIIQALLITEIKDREERVSQSIFFGNLYPRIMLGLREEKYKSNQWVIGILMNFRVLEGDPLPMGIGCVCYQLRLTNKIVHNSYTPTSMPLVGPSSTLLHSV
jgi:hypothetical protein